MPSGLSAVTMLRLRESVVSVSAVRRVEVMSDFPGSRCVCWRLAVGAVVDVSFDYELHSCRK